MCSHDYQLLKLVYIFFLLLLADKKFAFTQSVFDAI